MVAWSDGAVDLGSDVGVEPHLAFVQSKRKPRLPAHRIGGSDLEDNRIRSAVTVRIGQPDAVALAHLAGADALEREVAYRDAQRRGEPFHREVGRAFDDGVPGRLHAPNLGFDLTGVN